MIKIHRAPRKIILTMAVSAVTAVGGCGWVQVPGSGTRSTYAKSSAPNPSVASARVVPRPPVAERASAPAIRTLPNGRAVQVRPGDTVYALSRRYGVPAETIIQTNKLPPPHHLVVGQWVTLPRADAPLVDKGDAPDAGSAALVQANVLSNGQRPGEGQTPRIPNTGTRSVEAPTSLSAASTTGLSTSAAAAAKTSTAKPTSVVAKTPVPPPVALPPPPARAGGFVWPVDGKVVSDFGRKNQGLHNDGINISAARGTSVRAAENGVVAYAGNELRGFGNMLLIKHSGGWVTAYAHNETLLVGRGDKVKKGQVIAKVGTSGSVTAPQLHFELRKGKKPVDPLKYLGKGAV